MPGTASGLGPQQQQPSLACPTTLSGRPVAGEVTAEQVCMTTRCITMAHCKMPDMCIYYILNLTRFSSLTARLP